MASEKKDIKKELEETAKELKEKGVSGYENIIDRLNNERKKISREVDRDYKEARRYVRSNPEEGLLIALIGGLAIGLLLGRSSK